MGIGWYWMIQYWSSIGNYWTHERLRISTRMPVAHKFRIDTRCAKRIKMVDGLPRYSTCSHFRTMAAEKTCTIVDVICQNLGRRVFSTIYVIYVLRVFYEYYIVITCLGHVYVMFCSRFFRLVPRSPLPRLRWHCRWHCDLRDLIHFTNPGSPRIHSNSS